MLRFNCPHCHEMFEVPDSQAGTVLPCPLCGQEVQIPHAPQTAKVAPLPPRTTPGNLSTAPLRTCGLAIAALVCGLVMCIPPVALVGVVLGIVALTQIADPAKQLSGRGLAIAGIVTGAIGCTLAPAAMLIAILLPALSAARSAAQKMQSGTHLRFIHQGAIFHAQGNGGYYPGLDSAGQLTDATVEGRFLTLLQNNYVTGETLISPVETKTVWVGGALDTSMYSYSMLQIADPGERQAEWSETANADAAVMTDRAVARPGGIGSIHSDVAIWRGNVVWNDSHVTFERDHHLTTTYGPLFTANDNLFEPAGADDAYVIYSGAD